MRHLSLNTSFRSHLVIALITSLWLVIFLVLIAPFDIAELSLTNRLILMPPYGLISFIGYMMIIPLQNWLFRKSGLWTIVHEIGFFLVYNVLILIGCFFYYRSSFLNGAYDFERFSLEIYYPTFIILFIILILSRWFLFNQQAKSESTKIMLRGDNKLDILQISLSDLVSISSADNYVEISYLKEKELKKKLLRNTLKDLQQQVPSLIKIHRSHLINPDHFIAWKDSTTILLTQTELPATKSYKASLDFLNSIPKNL